MLDQHVQDETMFSGLPRSSELKKKQWSAVAGNELTPYISHINRRQVSSYITRVNVGYPNISIGVYCWIKLYRVPLTIHGFID